MRVPFFSTTSPTLVITYFIVILAFVWWSGTTPTIPLRYVCLYLLHCSGLEVNPHVSKGCLYLFLWCSWVLYLCTRPDSAFSNSFIFPLFFSFIQCPAYLPPIVCKRWPKCFHLVSLWISTLDFLCHFSYLLGSWKVMTLYYLALSVVLKWCSFQGFCIVGRNKISYILMEPFTCVCPFISKNITEYLWLPGQLWSSHSIC